MEKAFVRIVHCLYTLTIMIQKKSNDRTSVLLTIHDMAVAVDDKQVLHDLDLLVKPGTVQALMGPNGSGKSSLAATLIGNPKYVVTQGLLYFKDADLNSLPIDERSRKGIFLAMQNPIEIAGLSVYTLLKEACRARDVEGFPLINFTKHVEQMADMAGVPRSWLHRSMDSGFSGGEKKKLEILQMLVLKPQLAILDEIDSGLDIDALAHMAKVIQLYCQQYPEASLLVISHQKKFLDMVQPTYVHIMYRGTIVRAGDYALIDAIECDGYDAR
jgi:Fe-S cluster assembly ATP-binding protein